MALVPFGRNLSECSRSILELGDEDPGALFYINKLRERAGFPANSLTSLTLEKIQNERRVEMAFEDQRYFDLKRWRIADDVWDGDESENSTAVVYGLYPYRIAKANRERMIQISIFCETSFKPFHPGPYVQNVKLLFIYCR